VYPVAKLRSVQAVEGTRALWGLAAHLHMYLSL